MYKFLKQEALKIHSITNTNKLSIINFLSIDICFHLPILIYKTKTGKNIEKSNYYWLYYRSEVNFEESIFNLYLHKIICILSICRYFVTYSRTNKRWCMSTIIFLNIKNWFQKSYDLSSSWRISPVVSGATPPLTLTI